jgi:hypothetical protein
MHYLLLRLRGNGMPELLAGVFALRGDRLP